MRNPTYLLLFMLALIWSCNSSSEAEHGHTHEPGDQGHTHGSDDQGQAQEQFVVTDTLEKQVMEATINSPEYVQLATNVEIIPNIEDAVKSVGVLTHEGIFGPLLFAEQTRAFFIELKPGMFLSEHPHPTESIVYTVKGKWVLCSERKRQVIEAGSLFHFGSNMPTGWEAPFAEGAFLLVVKTKEEGAGYDPYMKGLRQMVDQLDSERSNGTPFYFNELPEDHEAIAFARSVNPDFDAVLESINY